MVFEEVAVNVTGSLEENLEPIFNFIKIIGGVVIVYVVFSVVSAFFNWKRNKYFKKMLGELQEINDKLGKKRSRKAV